MKKNQDKHKDSVQRQEIKTEAEVADQIIRIFENLSLKSKLKARTNSEQFNPDLEQRNGGLYEEITVGLSSKIILLIPYESRYELTKLDKTKEVRLLTTNPQLRITAIPGENETESRVVGSKEDETLVVDQIVHLSAIIFQHFRSEISGRLTILKNLEEISNNL